MFADEGDEGLGGAGEAAVAAVDEAEFSPEVDAFDGEELDFTGFHIVLGETFADEGDAGIGGNEAFDHADAGQLHGHVEARAVGAEELVEHLAGEASARKDERLPRDLFQRDLRTMSERVTRADHETQAVAMDVMHL